MWHFANKRFAKLICKSPNFGVFTQGYANCILLKDSIYISLLKKTKAKIRVLWFLKWPSEHLPHSEEERQRNAVTSEPVEAARLLPTSWKPLYQYAVCAVHCTLQRKNAKNSKQIFPKKEYRGLSPNFHIHVSVSELYIPTMELPFLLVEICGPILEIYKSLTDTSM